MGYNMTVCIVCGLSSERKLIGNIWGGAEGNDFLHTKHSSVIRTIKVIYCKITAFQILSTS